ncbi:MAG: 3-phosphoshikimate 1-carboxyvinyltransferase [Cyclobacteriaceae bacterium]|nr:3-phosphoshikimate 1-carboxyvinyltransferase [Cyclobacteriaceae bacterium]
MPNLLLKHTPQIGGIIQKLPASKSISNRALILDALSGYQSTISNLATARDTQLMKSLLADPGKIIDAMDAGTTMRFLTAYYAISGQNKVLTGTTRMKERPIGLLVTALREIGADIEYLEEEGFPPHEVKGFPSQKTTEISLPGNVSSQYISALMMIAPVLPEGLTINLEGKVGSWPYIEMTAALMASFGGRFFMKNGKVVILPGQYQPASITVEPDWSALSYWFAIVALAQKSSITLCHVSSHSVQGDRVIVEIMEQLGVNTLFENGNAILTKASNISGHLEWDFTDCPDLAQTVLPVCAMKGVRGTFTGLESLYIKETDRIAALQNELSKVDAKLEETSKGVFSLTPGKIPTERIKINTYHDHRMAMGFAPWATLMDIEIEAPEVVNKSYPEFWDDLNAIGFDIK